VRRVAVTDTRVPVALVTLVVVGASRKLTTRVLVVGLAYAAGVVTALDLTASGRVVGPRGVRTAG